jgi:hypothetical protein
MADRGGTDANRLGMVWSTWSIGRTRRVRGLGGSAERVNDSAAAYTKSVVVWCQSSLVWTFTGSVVFKLRT